VFAAIAAIELDAHATPMTARPQAVKSREVV
jgi:hypothetical protein